MNTFAVDASSSVLTDDILKKTLERLRAVDTIVSMVTLTRVSCVLVVETSALIERRQIEAEIDMLTRFSPKTTTKSD